MTDEQKPVVDAPAEPAPVSSAELVAVTRIEALREFAAEVWARAVAWAAAARERVAVSWAAVDSKRRMAWMSAAAVFLLLVAAGLLKSCVGSPGDSENATARIPMVAVAPMLFGSEIDADALAVIEARVSALERRIASADPAPTAQRPAPRVASPRSAATLPPASTGAASPAADEPAPTGAWTQPTDLDRAIARFETQLLEPTK